MNKKAVAVEKQIRVIVEAMDSLKEEDSNENVSNKLIMLNV